MLIQRQISCDNIMGKQTDIFIISMEFSVASCGPFRLFVATTRIA